MFSLDIVIASLGLIGILLSSMIAWDYTTNSIDAKERRNKLEAASFHTLSVLIETPGDPANWLEVTFNESNILSLGFASNSSTGLKHEGPWSLSRQKIDHLNSSHYNITKKILGLDGYEFSLTLKIYNGTGFVNNYSLSGERGNESEVSQKKRYALVDGSWVEIVLAVFDG